jgi:hypothetical protein
MRGINHHMTFWSGALIFILAVWAYIDAKRGNDVVDGDSPLLLIAGAQLVALGMWFVGLLFWGSWVIICLLGWLLIAALAAAALRQYLRERKEKIGAK